MEQGRLQGLELEGDEPQGPMALLVLLLSAAVEALPEVQASLPATKAGRAAG